MVKTLRILKLIMAMFVPVLMGLKDCVIKILSVFDCILEAGFHPVILLATYTFQRFVHLILGV